MYKVFTTTQALLFYARFSMGARGMYSVLRVYERVDRIGTRDRRVWWPVGMVTVGYGDSPGIDASNI